MKVTGKLQQGVARCRIPNGGSRRLAATCPCRPPCWTAAAGSSSRLVDMRLSFGSTRLCALLSSCSNFQNATPLNAFHLEQFGKGDKRDLLDAGVPLVGKRHCLSARGIEHSDKERYGGSVTWGVSSHGLILRSNG